MVKKFGDTIDEILSALQSGAAFIGVPPDRVKETGSILDIKGAAPFIRVYAVPSDSVSKGGEISDLDISIIICAESKTDAAKSKREAFLLAEKVLEVNKENPALLMQPTQPIIEFIGDAERKSLVQVNFTKKFRLY